MDMLFVSRRGLLRLGTGNAREWIFFFRDLRSRSTDVIFFLLALAIAAALNLKFYGADLNTAYLNTPLAIPQYVRGIEGFPCEHEDHVYIVRKALYGLRQAGREWNDELNAWMLSHDYLRCATEPCFYYRINGNEILLVVHVDILYVASNEKLKTTLFDQLDAEYGIKDRNLLAQCRGVEVIQTNETISINQRKYVNEILVKFGYEDAHPTGNPMETNMHLTPTPEDEEIDSTIHYRAAVGMLMYLATCTRPDIAYALGQLSRFVARPSKQHVSTIKRLLRYLAGSRDMCIQYTRSLDKQKNRNSTGGFVFVLAGGAIAWSSKQQPVIALSTAEAEYIAACEAAMEPAAERIVMSEILPGYVINMLLRIDSKSALIMATDPTYSRCTRHIELRWHFVRDQVQRKLLRSKKVCGDDNPADGFTKPLNKNRLSI